MVVVVVIVVIFVIVADDHQRFVTDVALIVVVRGCALVALGALVGVELQAVCDVLEMGLVFSEEVHTKHQLILGMDVVCD